MKLIVGQGKERATIEGEKKEKEKRLKKEKRRNREDGEKEVAGSAMGCCREGGNGRKGWRQEEK